MLSNIWTNVTFPRNEREDEYLEKWTLDCISKGHSACSRTGMKHWLSIGCVALLCSPHNSEKNDLIVMTDRPQRTHWMLVAFGLKLSTMRERLYDAVKMCDSLCVFVDSVQGRNTWIQLAFAIRSGRDIYNRLWRILLLSIDLELQVYCQICEWTPGYEQSTAFSDSAGGCI